MHNEVQQEQEPCRARRWMDLHCIPDFLYHACYLTGMQMLRLIKRSTRRVQGWAVRLGSLIQQRSRSVGTRLKCWFVSRKKALSTSWCFWMDNAKRFVSHVRQRWNYDRKLAFQEMLHGTGEFFRWFHKHALNYVLPVVGVAVLFGTVGHYMGQEYGLQVVYNGQTVGTVADEATYDSALAYVEGRLVTADGEQDVPTATFTLKAVDEDELLTADALTDQMIQASGNVIHEAAGLYVDNEFLGATTDGDQLLQALEERKAQYRTGDPQEKVEFVQNVQVKEGLYPVESIVDLENLEVEMDSEVAGQRTYTVEAGDAPYTIAQSQNISLSELEALNPGITETCLPGQEVLISQSVKRLSVKTVKYETITEEIAYSTERTNDSTLSKGTEKVTVKGQNGVREVDRAVTYVNGQRVSTEVLDTRVIQEPVTEEISVGTKRNPTYSNSSPSYGSGTVSDAGFMWPVAGGYISCGWYGYAGHAAIDIAASMGTPIYASQSGVVERATWGVTGEGNYVKIDHGNGYETLYAHCSALAVQAGQYVEQGQVIAYIGMTGWATGPHCHFEIYRNGVKVNPALYVHR